MSTLILHFSDKKSDIKLQIMTNSEPEVTPRFYIFAIGEKGEMFADRIQRKVRENGRNKKVKEPKYELKFLDWMSPSVNIIVMYYSLYGEFVYDAANVKIEFTTPNNVS